MKSYIECRNECGPLEGIDTEETDTPPTSSHPVEMSVARWRALTRDDPLCAIDIFSVEMSVARWSALTHRTGHKIKKGFESRNECCPFEGIDTLTEPLCRESVFCRNECGPFEGIDT